MKTAYHDRTVEDIGDVRCSICSERNSRMFAEAQIFAVVEYASFLLKCDVRLALTVHSNRRLQVIRCHQSIETTTAQLPNSLRSSSVERTGGSKRQRGISTGQ